MSETSGGMRVVRVRTARGWVVPASDATHFRANIRTRSPFPIVVDMARMLEGYEIVESLSDGRDHIIPGHDPLVLSRFAGVPGQVYTLRLDQPPIGYMWRLPLPIPPPRSRPSRASRSRRRNGHWIPQLVEQANLVELCGGVLIISGLGINIFCDRIDALVRA